MPKISAPSVADHRAQQRRALIAAARGLLEEGDASRVTFAAVAQRTGLARNSVYKYFTDRRELLAEVVREAAPRWTERIEQEMSTAAGPQERVAAYVRAQLLLVRDGEHRIAQALADDPDAAVLREAAAEAHDRILAPLVAALTELGDDAPRRTARLLQGFVNAATLALESGDDFDALCSRAVELTVASLGSLKD
ncbi:TetR/AcrR family transcriptional regulator [Streptomyces longispororuber]|uniref:TetR/AcrR family transcriptional regulator n=1 Tax=Streptomyces longispororuber TaxID=68230 RepID=UPI00210C5866|nr:TetR/AcrR family transcriptional regulator [Streptomyces longispororuber]MCQ4207540.1 TetR/AcrR family transcriptional regulator [Streptomyces longispororuber]